MRILATLLLLSAMTANGQLRLVGTNLYDFTPTRGNTNSFYHFSGTVVAITPAALKLQRKAGLYFEYKGPSQTQVQFSNSRDVLNYLAASRISGPSARISPGQYLTISWQLRQHYQPVQTYDEFYVLNAKGTIGEIVSGHAIPAGVTKEGDRVLNFGSPYTGSATNFTFIYTVYPKHIQSLRVRKPGEVTLQNQKRTSQTNDSQ